MSRTDVLVVSGGNTIGWQAAADELAGSISRAGASVEIAVARPAPRVRTFALTDLTQAWLARKACLGGIAAHEPASIVYCSITSALLWPRPGAITLDSLAAENRPGRHGVWQRVVERHRLEQATLVLVWSERSLAPLPAARVRSVLVPPPVRGSGGPGPRDIAAVTYAGDPQKRRLSDVVAAWERARRPNETLVVSGIDSTPQPLPGGVELAGRLAPADFHDLLRRARVFVAAPRREDFGIAALEALAEGCLLVTTHSPGPYPALEIARRLDPRLVDDDLPRALRIALDDPLPGYAERAAELLAPFRQDVIDRTVAREVLPKLLPGFERS